MHVVQPYPTVWKPSFVEVRVEPGLLVVTRSRPFDPGAKRGLDPRLSPEPALDRLLRQQPRADHHLRVRRVRTGVMAAITTDPCSSSNSSPFEATAAGSGGSRIATPAAGTVTPGFGSP